MALSCRFIIRYIVAKWHVLLWGLFFFSQTIAVNKDNFKTCDHSGFCKRQRHVQPGHSPYAVLLDSLVVKASSVEIQVLNRKNNIRFKLEVFALASNTARVKINEWAPIRPRYEIPVGDVLIGEPKQQQLTVLSKDAGRLVVGFEKNQVIINVDPLRIDFISNNEPIVSINTRGLLRFEHLQTKEDAKPGGDAQEADVNTEEKQGGDSIEEEKNDEKVSAPPNAEEADMWEETFKTFTDSKPHGPTSVGVDISFPGFEHVYGIPEHAETLSLKTTTSTDPYRLYNLDVFEYDLYNPMALYGSVPVMIAHNEKRAVGIFWQNAAETWIDISSNVADKNLFSKMIDFVKGDKDIPQTDTHWFSESGIIDVFIMLGPHPKDVFYQYSQLTGATPLPPLFGLAYHQSRWNYNDEEDVKNVDANFDKHDIPCDVIWLDIEHTDGKRYFTWDQLKFPHPEEMVQSLSSKGRKLVTIVDPHIKRDDNYKIYSEAKSKNYFIKNKDGNEYDGWCWPGSSSWPDYLNPEIRNWWAAKFDPAEYVGSSLDVYTWNDMNEPSVFNGPEITMHKDAIHLDGLEHREIHNIYGMYVHRATHEGLLMRTQNQERTFVLSRAFFAGSQRFGAVWTGDNIGEWSHLKISLPMILSLNLVGITFSGADVGGFFRNPDQELLTRWYQAASFQPFFRTHAHLDTKRREPWLLSEQNKNIIRNAIHTRYTFLSYWYLLFYNSEKTGQPVMAPLWVEFPTDSATFKMDDQYLVGPAILVKPIVEQSVTGTSIYFPGTNEIWYDILNFKSYQGGTSAYVEAPLEKIPVFQRGGYIIPRKYRMRRSSTLMKNDPFTLFVCLNKEGTAKGEVYTDDYHSLHYKKGEFAHRKIVFDNNRLVNGNLDPSSSYKTNEWVERVLIVGLEKQPARVLLTIEGSSSHLQFSFYVESKVLIIKKPGVNIAKDWTITLE